MPLGANRLTGYGSSVPITGLAAIDSNNSFYSNGTVSTNTITDSRTVTISLWFQHRATDEDPSSEHTVFNLTQNGGNSLLAMNLQAGRIRFINRNTTNSTAFAFDYLIGSVNNGTWGNGTYDDGNWHHVVFSWDGANSVKYCYVDGVSATVNTNSSRENYGLNGFEAEYDRVFLQTESPGGGNIPSSPITQLAVWTQYYDLTNSSVRSKFYNGGAVDLGADGTATGLDKPVVYHTGNSNQYTIRRGDTSRFNYSLTNTGTAVSVPQSLGPQLGA